MQLDVCHAMHSEGKAKDSRGDVDDDDSPMVVGHNIYILAYKLADHKKELKDALEKAEKQGHKAVQHYANNTAQIEVWCHTYMYMYVQCSPRPQHTAYLRDIGPICLLALIWVQAPPKLHPTNMPYSTLGEDTVDTVVA